MRQAFFMVKLPRINCLLWFIVILLFGIFGVLLLQSSCTATNSEPSLFGKGLPLPLLNADTNYLLVRRENGQKIIYDQQLDIEYPYGTDMPLIFIGGVPRSGTTLMRAMLDAHPDVRCGEETRVIPRILGMRTNWQRSAKEKKRLEEAGLSDSVIDSAISSFILEIIVKHGKPAPRLCNKDPFTLKSAVYLSKLFPNSKFIMMIRDGRATVHSIISRGVTISGFDLKSFRQCMEKWNQAISTMYHQCFQLGESKCFPMYYEKLVLDPEKQLRSLAKFLDIPWNNSLLHHEQYIGKEISLSKTERSTDQIIKPVYLDSMSKWVGHVPEDVFPDLDKIAPMLSHLGYDPKSGPDNPPNYGKASKLVQDNVVKLNDHKPYWDKKIKQFYNNSTNSVTTIKRT